LPLRRFPLTLESLSCGVHPEALFILHNEKKPSSLFCERRSEKEKNAGISLDSGIFLFPETKREAKLASVCVSESRYHFKPV
jgi:hypothetical protein